MAMGAKAERTLFAAGQVANLRANLAQSAWARQQRDQTLKAVEKEAVTSCAELVRYVPDPRIPRSAYVHETECPNCGLALRKFGLYSWIITPEKPYRLTCPNCKSVYPSNDYQAFLESGLQNRALLTGEFPDDGWGWESPRYPGQKYWFVAYYNHWMARRRLLPAIENLAKAYLYTDEPAYAHRCGALLWQLATYYPQYDYARQSRDGLERDPGYKGRLFYYTWECFTVTACATAYDAIFPALVPAVPELERLTGQSMPEIRHRIEEQLLRSMAREIVQETHVTGGNYGMHQAGLLQIAAVLRGTPGDPDSAAMVNWLLHNPEYPLYIYMSLHEALTNLVYRDGVPFESPGYNLGWVENLTTIAELLRVNEVDVFALPRFRRLYDWGLDAVCAGRFTPALGDSGNLSNVGRMWRAAALRAAYEAYRDPRYAQALLSLSPEGDREITAKDITAELKAAAATLKQEPSYESRHLAGYGLATLQNGRPDAAVAAALFYGRFVGHAHHDKLHLDLFAQNVSMIPDFGYPETANSNDPRRFGFLAHTVAHNTVMVDARNQANGRGRCLAYDSGPGCQYVEARNDQAYPHCSEYRRSVLLVEAEPGRCYLVDVFHVRGGRQHDWLVHGGHADFDTNLTLTVPRAAGTLAGADVPYGHFYDDARLGAAPYGGVSYVGYAGSAFQFLYNVQEGDLQPGAWGRWRFIGEGPRASALSTPAKGAFLKAHLPGENERVFVCDGKPQQNRKDGPASVRFLVRRRLGADLESTFVTVFEPGAGEDLVRAVVRLPCARPGLVALRLELAAGAVHYVFCAATADDEPVTVDGVTFAGQVGHLARGPAGQVQAAYLYNATRLALGDWQLSGDAPLHTRIAACDYRANRITLADALPAGRAPTGVTVSIDSGAYGSSFEVRATEGDRTLVLGDQEPLCSQALVHEVQPAARRLLTPTTLYFPQPGMQVTDEALRPVARLASLSSGELVLDREVSREAFPDADGDGAARACLMEYGPGDRVTVPVSVRYVRP